jgi:hypothetical protein
MLPGRCTQRARRFTDLKGALELLVDRDIEEAKVLA